MSELTPGTDVLVSDLRRLIEASRERVASTVNRVLVMLHWRVGHRIHAELLEEGRAAYGEQIVSTLSAQLVPEYGRGFGRRNLYRMISFAQLFPDEEVVAQLSERLSWSHFVELLKVEDALGRKFYAEMSRHEHWSVRTLRDRISSMLFERTAISKRPDELIRGSWMHCTTAPRSPRTSSSAIRTCSTSWACRTPGKSAISKQRSSAIFEAFLLEFGSDFCFVARQKRIVVDGEDHYIDLLFFHRGLSRLVVVELKLGRLQAADKGQLELYLRWLDRHERRPHEESPLGLVLCADKGDELVELLELEASGIRVAEYLTVLPPRAMLERKLLDAISVARQRASKEGPEPDEQ